MQRLYVCSRAVANPFSRPPSSTRNPFTGVDVHSQFQPYPTHTCSQHCEHHSTQPLAPMPNLMLAPTRVSRALPPVTPLAAPKPHHYSAKCTKYMRCPTRGYKFSAPACHTPPARSASPPCPPPAAAPMRTAPSTRASASRRARPRVTPPGAPRHGRPTRQGSVLLAR